MSVSEDAVLAYWKEHREQLRQSEAQRAVITNYVLVITAGLGGFIAQQKFAATTIPASLLIVFIGLFGALTAAKYHERANYHLGQARALTKTLSEMELLGSDAPLDAARQEHYSKFPAMRRIRLHALWTALHLGVAIFGCSFVVLALAT